MGSGNKPSVPAYQSTSVTNPYASAYVNRNGTSSYSLNDFLSGMNSMAENVLPSLYGQLLYPNLDNPVSNARMEAFNKTLSSESYKQFENNLNALSQRGMLRSSAVNDMANKLSEYQTSQLANYANNLISNNTNEVTSLLNTFLNQYLLGADIGNSTLSNAMQANQLLNNHNLAMYQQMSQAYQKSNNLLSSGMGLAGVMLGSLLGDFGSGGNL